MLGLVVDCEMECEWSESEEDEEVACSALRPLTRVDERIAYLAFSMSGAAWPVVPVMKTGRPVSRWRPAGRRSSATITLFQMREGVRHGRVSANSRWLHESAHEGWVVSSMP